MDLLLNQFIRTIDDPVEKHTWKTFQMISYDFLERNKDKLVDIYHLERYNPTDMTTAFIKWSKDNNRAPITETTHGRPYYINDFLGSLYWNT